MEDKIEALQLVLITATFLCSLVAGFLFAFAVVIMPGYKSLDNEEFIRAFQVIDKIIQNNQPLFMLVWVGSLLVMIVSLIMGFYQLSGLELLLLVSAAILYLFGVQLPTIINNIPLNNKLQTIEVDVIGEADAKNTRENFEARWNFWNLVRTVVSSLVSALLIILLLIL